MNRELFLAKILDVFRPKTQLYHRTGALIVYLKYTAKQIFILEEDGTDQSSLIDSEFLKQMVALNHEHHKKGFLEEEQKFYEEENRILKGFLEQELTKEGCYHPEEIENELRLLRKRKSDALKTLTYNDFKKLWENSCVP